MPLLIDGYANRSNPENKVKVGCFSLLLTKIMIMYKRCSECKSLLLKDPDAICIHTKFFLKIFGKCMSISWLDLISDDTYWGHYSLIPSKSSVFFCIRVGCVTFSKVGAPERLG